MARVFISYRRADSATATGRIYDRLVQRFGKKHIFKDVDDIPPGVNFATFIQDAVRQCSVLLVVIGRDWLASTDAGGRRRLDDPADYVRIEIETALALSLPIIPLLVEGATMPHRADLPPSLQPLALINALPVRDDPDFSRDMERVAAAIGPHLVRRTSPSGILARLRPRPSTPAPSSSAATPSLAMPPSASRVPGSPSHPADVSAPTVPAPASPRADAPAALPAQSPPASAAMAPPKRPAAGAAASSAAVASPRRRARRPPPRALLLASLAAVLVVASFGVLISAQEGLGPFAPDFTATNAAGTRFANGTDTAYVRAATANQNTYQTRVAASKTAFAKSLFPYAAAAPGPGCDSGPATWAYYGTGDPRPAQSDIVKCASDGTHTTLVAKPTKAKDGSYYSDTSVTWSAPVQWPSTVTFSITVTNRFSDMMSVLDVEAASTRYLLQLNAPNFHRLGGSLANGYEALRCGGADGHCTGVGLNGSSYQTTGPHTLTISINSRSVTFKIDKTTIGTYPEASQVIPQDISLDIGDFGTAQSCSADFADFHVDA